MTRLRVGHIITQRIITHLHARRVDYIIIITIAFRINEKKKLQSYELNMKLSSN